MTFALVGLIVLQGYWLKNAYKVKEDHFSQQVTHALFEICKRAEARETIVEISNEMFSLNNNSQEIPELYRYYNSNALNRDTSKNAVAVSRESVVVNKNKDQQANTKITVLNGDSIVFNRIISRW